MDCLKNSIYNRFIACLFVCLFHLQTSSQIQIKKLCDYQGEQIWHGFLTLNDSTELPFWFNIFNLSGKSWIEVYNSDEVIRIDELNISSDSVNFLMPVFKSEFFAKIYRDNAATERMTGIWVNYNRSTNQAIKFHAVKKKFEPDLAPQNNLYSGNWEVTFSHQIKDSSKAIGVFQPTRCNSIAGTFLTETGDYRFLTGTTKGDCFYLSCFDGSHAFYFKSKRLANGTLLGDFYSGNHWHEPWIAHRNERFMLRNPDSLTYIQSDRSKLSFRYPNTNGIYISLDDQRFQGKVTIIQIMGSWCPNCMDESAELQKLYTRFHSSGLEIVGLAFEKTKDTAIATSRVKRFKERMGCDYDFLITGQTGKEAASAAFPMLNGIMSFPTTIYIDRKGNIRKIYTGFYGPATGKYYEQAQQEMTQTVEKLLSER